MSVSFHTRIVKTYAELAITSSRMFLWSTNTLLTVTRLELTKLNTVQKISRKQIGRNIILHEMEAWSVSISMHFNVKLFA